MPQKQFAVGTVLSGPAGRDVTVSDPNQFFSESYQVKTPAPATPKPQAFGDVAQSQILNIPISEVQPSPDAGETSLFDSARGTKPTDVTPPIDQPEKFTPPTPTAPEHKETFVQSAESQLQSDKEALQKERDRQMADIEKRRAEAEKEKATALAGEQKAITDQEQYSLPFRQKLEETERERLKVEENFFANQQSIKELDALMNQARSEVDAMRQKSGLAVIRTPRINQKIDDYNARIGVVQAVMAARNGQITVAERLIDRTIDNINADRTDAINYYEKVREFYEGVKDDAGDRIIDLDADTKEILDGKIDSLKEEVETSRANAEAVKELMLENPDLVERAGISLNDDITTIAKKISEYEYRQEGYEVRNELEKDGYRKMMDKAEAQRYSDLGRKVITITDSRGNESYYLSDEGKLSDLAKQVAANPRLLGMLTASDQKDVLDELANNGYDINEIAQGYGGLTEEQNKTVNSLNEQFQNKQVVKDYLVIAEKANSVESIINNGVSGPRDLALVFEFMKALDPTSVVRETEYDSAAKSGNIFSGWAAKFNGYLKAEGGFLPENVKQEFLAIAQQKLASKQAQYDKLRQQYGESVNRLTGREDGEDFIFDLSIQQGASGVAGTGVQGTTPVTVAPEVKQGVYEAISSGDINGLLAETAQKPNGTGTIIDITRTLGIPDEQYVAKLREFGVVIDNNGKVKSMPPDINQKLTDWLMEASKPGFKNEGGDSDNAQIGTLSQRYESGGDPGAIGYDRTGGYSYGTYQLAHNNAKSFVDQSPYADQFKGLTFNSTAWRNKWKEVAKRDPEGFTAAQHNYIKQSHFDPQMKKVADAGFHVEQFSPVLQDVIWSTAVQHGANTDVVVKALEKAGKDASDADIIREIYKERWSGGRRFANSTKAVRNSVYRRFFSKDGELNKALSQLA